MTQFTGTPNADTLTGGVDADTLQGLEGADRLVGGGGADQLYGGAGDDSLVAGQGALVVDGGAGIDTAELDFHGLTGAINLSVADAQAGVNIAGTQVQGIEQISIVSGSGADTLIGGARADSLDAGAGADVVTGGLGDKLLAGGAGTDLAHLDFAGAKLSLRYTAGAAATQTLSGVQVSGFEQVDMVGGSAGDWLTGGLLNDTLDGRAGNDWLKGDGGDDLLKGGDGMDILDGGAGNDTLDGGGITYTDQLSGGDGDDLLIGDAGDAQLDGGAGKDTGVLNFSTVGGPVSFSVAANLAGPVKIDVTTVKNLEIVDLTTSGGNDSLTGGAYADTLHANGGDDSLAGGGGDDSLDGGAGGDVLSGGAGDDQIDGGAGFDTARFSGQASDYKAVLLSDGGLLVTDLRPGMDGVDTIHGVEQFAFADRTLSYGELATGTANRAPMATDDVVTVSEDTGLGIQVLANDSDPDLGDRLHLISVNTAGLKGGADIIEGGVVLYSPGAAAQHLNAGETLVEHFTYTVGDAHGATSTAGVTVTVTGVNDAPTAVEDHASVGEDAATAIHVLANDSDVDTGDTLTLQAASNGRFGSTRVTADGDVIYTPGDAAQSLNAGQTQGDTFSYTVRDSHGATTTTTVGVVIQGANDAPTTVGEALSAAKSGVSVFNTLLSNDFDVDSGDSIRIGSVQAVSTKGAAVTLDAQGHVAYDPGALFSGLGVGQTAADSFTYTVVDSHGAASTATVALTITGAPIPEEGLSLDTSTLEDGQTEDMYQQLLDQAQYALGEPVTLVSIDTAGTKGSVALGDHSLVYTADDPSFDPLWADFSAHTQFQYTVRTASGELHTGEIGVRVYGVNDDPAAVADAVGVVGGGDSGELWSSLMGNDSDVDGGQVFAISGVDVGGTQGHVAFDASAHSLVYSADSAAMTALKPGETLTDHFSYTIRDEMGATSTAVVTVTVTGHAATLVHEAGGMEPEAGVGLTPPILASLADLHLSHPQSGWVLS